MGKISEQAIELRLSKNVVPLTRSNLGPASTSRIGLDIPIDLPLEEWALLGDALSACEQSVMWWIGDWWAHGGKYGERSRVLEQLREAGHNPPPFNTCTRAADVARAFESTRRRVLLSFDDHKVVASLDERDQDWLLDRAQANDWTHAELRDEVRRYKLDMLRRPGERKYETQTIEDLHELVKSGKRFGTVYADPPWPYDNQGTRSATRRHYKEHNTMSIDDICALPVPQLLADNGHCHLWTTNSFLREAAVDVLEAWGVTYKSCLVWVKPDFGIGNYWRVGHEFLLLGVRGKAPFQDNSQQSWLYQQAGEHSVKPAKIRRLIERCSPGPYLELFGRQEVENWTVWGNEIERITDATPLFNREEQDE